MSSHEMLLHVFFLRELSSTHKAAVRSLPCVAAYMTLKFGEILELLATDLTLMLSTV